MKKLKQALSLSLALALSLAFAVPVSAANPITLSENNVTVTFSDVISYEDVRVCFPGVESDDPDTYYLYCTDIRIYHFPSTGIKTTMYNDRWDNSTSELNMVYEGYFLDPERMEPVFLNDDDEEPTMVRVPYPACTPLVQIVGEEEIYGQVNSKPVSKGELSEELPVNISTKLGKFISLSVNADEILGPGIGGESAVLAIYCAFDDGKFSYKDNAVVTTTPTTPTQPEQPTTPTDPETPTQPTQPEQPTTPATPVVPGNPGSYTVKKGDTWSSICINFYGTNAQRGALQKANKNVKLKEGAVITLPEKLGKDTLIPAPAAGAGEKLYTVQAGDTLGRIAAAEYGKAGEYKAIFERNADRLKNANTIYEGQVIVLPAKK